MSAIQCVQQNQAYALPFPTDTKSAWEYMYIHAHEKLAQTGNFPTYKLFGKLYYDIAVSENGWIGIYKPYVPAIRESKYRVVTNDEEYESFDVIHISQIIDFDIEVDEETETAIKQKSGLGGAIVGGLIGGTTGALIGGAASRGGKAKVEQTTTLNGIDLIINTSDFNNPRLVVPIYRPRATPRYNAVKAAVINTFENEIIAKKGKCGVFDMNRLSSTAEYVSIRSCTMTTDECMEEVEELQATLNQLLSKQMGKEKMEISSNQLSTADELMKYKTLLDNGIITQEEFDAMKKTIIGVVK